jgi:hypothetical protein
MSVWYSNDALDVILVPEVFEPFKKNTLAWAEKQGTKKGVNMFVGDGISVHAYYDEETKYLYTMYSGDPMTIDFHVRKPGSRTPSLDFSVKVRDKKDCLEMMLKRYERPRG